MRAMKINEKASAFGLFLALVAFAGTVILHFSNLMSFSFSEWWCCDTQSKTAPTHHGICLLSEHQIHTLCCLVLTKHNSSTWAIFSQYCFEEQWVPGEIWEFKRKAEGDKVFLNPTTAEMPVFAMPTHTTLGSFQQCFRTQLREGCQHKKFCLPEA